MRLTWLARAGIALVVAWCLPISAASVTLTGFVKDIGRLKSKAAGLKGVEVSVEDTGGREVGVGLSGPQGAYRVDNLPMHTPLKAVFDRSDYLERHKSYPIVLETETTDLEVLLKQDSDDQSYNAQVAENLAKQAGKGEYGAFSLLQAESVPASQRLALRIALGKRMKQEAIEFAVFKGGGDKRTLVANDHGHSRGAAGSWSGWITDDSSGAKGANAALKDCAVNCAEKGGSLVLYNTADKKLYKLDKQDLARQHLGHEVTVKGTAAGDKIVVDSISPKDHG